MKKKKAYTLIELLTVVAVLGILVVALIVGINFSIIDTPIAKARGFLVLRPLPCSSAGSYMVFPSVWVRACPALPCMAYLCQQA